MVSSNTAHRSNMKHSGVVSKKHCISVTAISVLKETMKFALVYIEVLGRVD